MAEPVSSLYATLTLEADNFNNGLKAAAKEAKAFEASIKPTLQAAKDIGLAMSAAGAAITGAMGLAAKSAIDYGDELNDASQRTGASVETLAKLGLAAQQSGTSFEGLSTGMKFLAKNMEAANAGGKQQQEAFSALGISSKQLTSANGDLNKVFMLVADRFKEMPDGAEKSAAAMKIFGKSGTDLIPMLNEGSAGLERIGQQAEKAGLVMSQETAAACDQLNDTLEQVHAAAMGVGIGIAQALLPSLQTAASVAADAGGGFASVLKQFPELTQAAAFLGVGLTGVGATLGTIGVVLPKVEAGILMVKAAAATTAGTVGIAVAAIAAAAVAIYEIGEYDKATANLAKAQKEQTSAIEKAAEALRAKGIAVDLAGKSEAEQTRIIAKAGRQLVNHTAVVRQNTAVVKDAATIAKEHEEALKRQAEAADMAAKGFRVSLDMMNEVMKAQALLVRELTSAHWSLDDSITAGAKAAVDASADYANFIQIVKDFADGMAQADYNAREMEKDFRSVMQVDPGVHIGEGLAKVATESKKTANEYQKAWETAVGNVTSGIAKGLSDAIFNAKSFKDSMINVAKQAAEGMLQAFITGLLTPLMAKLSGLGGSLMSAIGIGGGVAGSAAGAGAAGAGGAGAGAGAGAGGAAMSGTALAATAGVAAAVVAAIAWAKSQAHWEANTFVNQVQNPFGQQLANISDSFALAEQTGQLTVDQAEEAKKAVEDLWKTFQTQANQFAAKGSDQARVVQQAFAQLNPFMTRILDDMNSSIRTLQIQSGNLASAAAIAAGSAGSSLGISGLDDALIKLAASAGTAAASITSSAQAIANASSTPSSGTIQQGQNGGTTGQRVVVGSTPTPATTPVSGPIQPTVNGPVTVTPPSYPSGSQTVPVANPFVNVYSQMPSYAIGTPFVPRTGPALLHRGEAVIPAGQNAGMNVTINVAQASGEDGEALARRIARILSRQVQFGGSRLVASQVGR